MGQRFERTIRQRYGLGVLPTRDGTQPRLPVGRGWTGKDLRLIAETMFHFGIVERTRCDFERTAIRAEQPGRKPQEDVKGCLLLSGRDCDADTLLPEDVVQVSANSPSIRPTRGGESAAHSPPSRNSNSSTRESSTKTAIGMLLLSGRKLWT